MIELSCSVQTLLSAWGRSKTINDPGHIDYPHEAAFSVLSRQPGSWAINAADIDEDTYAKIDRAVSSLKMRGDYRHRVLVLFYINLKTDSKIGRILKLSRADVAALRCAAESWVESQLYV